MKFIYKIGKIKITYIKKSNNKFLKYMNVFLLLHISEWNIQKKWNWPTWKQTFVYKLYFLTMHELTKYLLLFHIPCEIYMKKKWNGR